MFARKGKKKKKDYRKKSRRYRRDCRRSFARAQGGITATSRVMFHPAAVSLGRFRVPGGYNVARIRFFARARSGTSTGIDFASTERLGHGKREERKRR